MDSTAYLLIFGCCFIGILIVAVIVAVQYSRRTSGPQATTVIQQLAGQMGLKPLNPQRPYRFGGMYQDRAFYIDLGISGSVLSRNVSLGKAVAVSIEVQMREPRQGYAYCNRGRVSSTSTFEAAFSAKLQYEWIANPAREAMLSFVRKRDNLFLEGLPIYPKPQSEDEDKVRLQHNIPNTGQITTEAIWALLDELAEVARVIEETC